MEQTLILLLLAVNVCSNSLVIKHYTGEEKNDTENSFQGLGYGVHHENTTIVTPSSPVYYFHDPNVKSDNRSAEVGVHRDQHLQSNGQLKALEKNSDADDKSFHVTKTHRDRSVAKRKRPRLNEMLEHKDLRHHVRLPPGAKMIEVLKIPAVYELHLQSDPQRVVSVNPWGDDQSYQSKRPVQQPVIHITGNKNHVPKNLEYSSGMNTFQHQAIDDMLQELKLKLLSQNFNGRNQANGPSLHKAATQQISTVQNHGNYQNNLVRPTGYGRAMGQDKSVPDSYRQSSHQTTSDSDQKPQALHEVPAPSLNGQPHKYVKTPQISNLVYGKSVDAYHSSPGVPPRAIYGYNRQVIPDYYQQHSQHIRATAPPLHVDHNSEATHQNYFANQEYHNNAIGNTLDQNLAVGDGGVANYLNEDGTLIVSNHNHNPKSYGPADYNVSPNKGGLSDYASDNYVYNQVHSGFSPEIPFYEQGRPNAGGGQDQQFQPFFPTRGGRIARRLHVRPISHSNRRSMPADYVIYIKQRTLD